MAKLENPTLILVAYDPSRTRSRVLAFSRASVLLADFLGHLLVEAWRASAASGPAATLERAEVARLMQVAEVLGLAANLNLQREDHRNHWQKGETSDVERVARQRQSGEGLPDARGRAGHREERC